MTNREAEPRNYLLVTIEKAYDNYNHSLQLLLIFLLFKFVIDIFFCVSLAINNGDTLTTVAVGILNIIVFLLSIPVLVNVYKITRLLKQNNKDEMHPILWVFLMFIPLFNVIAIFLIYSKARKFIKKLRGKMKNRGHSPQLRLPLIFIN